MIHCGIKEKKPLETVKNTRKPFAHLPITTPWRYKVPLNSKQGSTQNCYRNIKSEIKRQPVSNVCKYNAGNNFSKQYQNFLRLMHLFPSVHPANIFGILLSCNYDIYRTVDKLQKTIQSVKGVYRQNNGKYINSTCSNYSLLTYSKFNNKYCSNYYLRKPQELRNCSNIQLPLLIVKPESGSIIPTYCTE